MNSTAWYEKQGHKCKFNEGVGCYKQDRCAKCGFNPDVYAVRVERIREKRNGTGGENDAKEQRDD